jgi:Fe-S cluster assembly protein SufD
MQLFKGVLSDASQSSFEGKILVRPEAQKTEAYQLNKNLILNQGAVANSKPNLEIFADDVKASHGATVSQLDQEQLFYLSTRGIDINQARRLLISGFCREMIERIPYDSLLQKMLRQIQMITGAS